MLGALAHYRQVIAEALITARYRAEAVEMHNGRAAILTRGAVAA